MSEKSSPSLGHPAKRLFIFKRRESEVITRCLDDTEPLSSSLRLRGAMFNHHMPWGYNALFDGYGSEATKVDLSTLPIDKEGLYPSLP